MVYGHPAIAVPIHSIGTEISIFPFPDSEKQGIILIDEGEGFQSTLHELPDDHFLRIALNTLKKELEISRYPSMKLRITSTIPIAAGLGSSAAFAVALSKSLVSFLGLRVRLEKINQMAYAIEKIQHGTPSGIDNTVISYNKPILFQKNHPVLFLDIKKTVTMIVADTGIRTPTRETVQEVKRKYDQDRKCVAGLFFQIAGITQSAVQYLRNGNITELGLLMNQNHQLLQELGVSCESLDHLVRTAQTHHALGAKLCGGGKGGNIVAVSQPETAQEIRTSLLKEGAITSLIFQVKTNPSELSHALLP